MLVEYVELLQSLADDTGGTKLARRRTLKGLAAPLGHALHALVEARGLAGQSAWPAWESLVLLASRLATLGVNRVELRRT